MSYITATCTDIGIRKETNEDSALIMQAETDMGTILLASICDGMGGLAKGEAASAIMVASLSNWFRYDLPKLLANGFSESALWSDWYKLIINTNDRIADYGAGLHVDLGTTVVALLTLGDKYYTLNVGDSRIYLISNKMFQITKDQTYVQREIDAGRLTPQEALYHPKRSVLLQCVGASNVIEPEFLSGTFGKGTMFMLCSDGFRHWIPETELYRNLKPSKINSREKMKKVLNDLIQLNINRGEDDNITALLAKG